MATLSAPLGGFSWICGGVLDAGSSCTQRSIIDAINLLFLSVFYLILLIQSTCKKRHVNCENITRDWVLVSVSICCALTGFAYLFAIFWDLRNNNGGFQLNHLSWLVSLLRALIWVSLAVSILVNKVSKSIRVLVNVWWVSFFVLVSALNAEILCKTHSIGFSEIIPWFVNSLLLVCASRSSTRSDPQTSDGFISEPLLVEKTLQPRTGLCQAGFLSRLTFSWMNPLLGLGYSKPLALEDIPSLDCNDEANVAHQKFADAWETIQRGKNSSNNRNPNMVVQAMAKVYWKETVLTGMFALLKIIAAVVSPLLLYAFVNYSSQVHENLRHGLMLVGSLLMVKVVESLTQRHMFFNSRRSGMRMRSALMVAIYQKQLRLSSLGRRRHSVGEIVNYIAVDAYRMGEFPWWFHCTWSFALQLFLSVGVLFGIVGMGSVLGTVPLLISGLLNVPFAKLLQECQSHFMVAQDERLRCTSELLNNMKVIKLQSWEDKFKSVVESLRDREFKWLAKGQFRKAYGTLLFWSSPTIISSVIFVGCALFHSAPLDAGTIFTVLATLRCMAEPVKMIPEALSVLIQVKVSFDRLSNFLLDCEIKNEGRIIAMQNADESIAITAGNFIWEPELAIPTLKNINLEVKRGQRIAICGPIGAGKSSLLCAILGELPKVSGRVNVFGSIAYVSQVSWIQSGTIRENVLYGKAMDKARYMEAIKVCALDKDIHSFIHGDLTEIGQRGLNMSGGQKQRIQLARAVYNDADIYLLDDPFSAVDANTAAALFNDCVIDALKGKTVILVTHQVEFLPEMAKILVMEGGQVTQSGSYEELLMAGTAFEQLVNAHNNAITVLNPSVNEKCQTISSRVKKSDWKDESSGSHTAAIETTGTEISNTDLPAGQLTEEEEKEIGDVGWKPFWDYIFISKGAFLLFLCIMSQVGFVGFQAMATYWLAVASRNPKISTGTLIGVYTGISSLSACFVYLRSLCGVHCGLKASNAFFSSFTNAIFKAPMLFFDSTPIGRIFTRASSDLSVLDFDIPFSIIFVIGAGMELVAIIGIMASVTWQVLIVATLAMVVSAYAQAYYLASARELIRINGTTKAPVMNYASETSLGVVTIRAFNMADRFFQNYIKLVDIDAKLFFHSNAALEWLIVRIEVLQNLTLLTAALLLVLLPKGVVAPELVGLSLSYALTLTATQVFWMRWYCSLSNYIVSIERIKQFMDIPSEPAAIVEGNRPPLAWPSKGRIKLQNLKVRYRPNAPLVLKGITCTFKEGTRIGVVGRTGSGKTTLITALFRLVEPDSGAILIDGLDICSIGLKDLRMRLSIIPQEATLFRGSIRTNLDPLGIHSDDQIWEAAEKCQLMETIRSLPNLLDSSVSDEGDNWSAGQRQLFCLGRALLRRNRILVLDEATASVDSATDALLQRIVREEFSECTVITVAHRVPTVIDSDMVMVLSYGNLVEYDEPSVLMQMNSSFSKLVAEYWTTCRRNSLQGLNKYY